MKPRTGCGGMRPTGRRKPVLNAIAASDPYFAPGNPWNAAYPITGSCAQALRGYKDAAVYMPLTDKHTIINDADVRGVTALFLRRVLAPLP